MKHKILIVDDEDIIRRRLKKLLILDNYEVFTAESGQGALDIIQKIKDEKQAPFNVALVDIKMPGMDGIEVLKRIKKSMPQTEIIIITGQGTVETAITSLKNGAFDYITKPIEYDELTLNISRAIEKQVIISKRKQAEEKLRKKNKELKDFHDVAVDRELRMKEMEEEMGKMKMKEEAENTKQIFEEKAEKLGKSRAAMIYMLKDLNKTAKELTASKNYTESIIQNLLDTLIVVDNEEKIKIVNPVTCHLLGYTEKELIGQPVSIIFEEEEEGLFKVAGIKDLIKKGSVTNKEKTYLTKDGRKIPVLFSGAVMYYVDCPRGKSVADCPEFTKKGVHCKKSQGVVCVASDITMRKQAEQAIRKHSEELEQQVEIRTMHIQKLEQQRMAAEKLIALGQISAGIAHEINNPLATIKNCFHIVKGTLPHGHDKGEFVDFIDDNIERISEIVKKMYYLYSPSYTKPRPLLINKLLSNIIITSEGIMSSQGIKLQDERLASDIEVFLPMGELIQIFTNIIHNALSAMPEGGCLHIKTNTDDNNNVVIEIADTGTGIEADILPHIFEPFFSTKLTSKDPQSGGGMGLGLSVTHSLVEGMGGSIEVKTKPGEGTCFIISLPLEYKPNQK